MKYKLTKNKIEHFGRVLFQIKALKDFGNVKKGDKGGWIEKKENLNQNGDARVFDNAWVFDNARVSGDAMVYGDARVFDNARVSGDAMVYGDARVSGDAMVYGDARVSGDAMVYGDAWVYGNAWVYGDAMVYGKFKLTSGYFFGWKEKDEELSFFEDEDGDELIGKGDCKVEICEEKKESKTFELSNGAKVSEETIREALEFVAKNK